MASIARFAKENDAAFLLFLRSRIFQDDHFAVFDFVLEQQQPAVCVDDDGFAGFAKLFAVVVFSGCLDGHAAKDACASAWGRKSRFSHTSIFKAGRFYVNREANWLYRIHYCLRSSRLVPVLTTIYDERSSGEKVLGLSEFFSSPQHSCDKLRIRLGKDLSVPFL